MVGIMYRKRNFQRPAVELHVFAYPFPRRRAVMLGQGSQAVLPGSAIIEM